MNIVWNAVERHPPLKQNKIPFFRSQLSINPYHPQRRDLIFRLSRSYSSKFFKFSPLLSRPSYGLNEESRGMENTGKYEKRGNNAQRNRKRVFNQKTKLFLLPAKTKVASWQPTIILEMTFSGSWYCRNIRHLFFLVNN